MIRTFLSSATVFAFLAAVTVAMPGTASAEPVQVELKTTKGDIVIELNQDKAPISTENFLSYVKSGLYEGTVFHRVIPNFMIQGGGMDASLEKKKVQAPIKNESSNGLLNKKYTVAMARTSDPNSATSQFFVNTADNGFLNKAESQDGYGYAVFGRVVSGFDVVDQIEAVETGKGPNPNFGPMTDVPTEPITITKVRVLEPAEVVGG